MNVEIKPINKKSAGSAFSCLREDRNNPLNTTSEISREYFKNEVEKSFSGYHLFVDNEISGHLYYSISQNSILPFTAEDDVILIICTWILRKYRNMGLGKSLFERLKEDNKDMKGIVVRATTSPIFMYYTHFQRFGFRPVYQDKGYVYMYLPLKAEKVKVIIRKERNINKEGIFILRNNFCPMIPFKVKEIKRIAAELNIHCEEVEVNHENIEKYGIDNGVFINGMKYPYNVGDRDLIKKIIYENLY